MLSSIGDKKRNSLLKSVLYTSYNKPARMPAPVQILPLSGLPLIKPGDDLPRLIVDSARKVGWGIREKDVLVVGQKAVSKAEGRLVNLGSVHPSKEALILARKTGRKPEFVQIVLNNSRKVVRAYERATEV